MCLFKCITGLVSEKPIAVNVLTSPRNSCNMQKRTFILLRPFQIELEKVIFNPEIFASERVNESQKLLQYAKKNFYPTFSSFWAKLS